MNKSEAKGKGMKETVKRCGFCGLPGHRASDHAEPPNLEG